MYKVVQLHTYDFTHFTINNSSIKKKQRKGFSELVIFYL